MPSLVDAPAHTSQEQLTMPAILINPFEVPEDVADDHFLAGWERAAEFMTAQRGFLSSRLHRALRPDARFRFVNFAEWTSPADFQAAVSSETFRRMSSDGVPANYPALYEVVRTVVRRMPVQEVQS